VLVCWPSTFWPVAADGTRGWHARVSAKISGDSMHWYTCAFQRTYEPNQRETLEAFEVVFSARKTQISITVLGGREELIRRMDAMHGR
jgi:hypothetical protein